MRKTITIEKNKICLEDLEFGLGTVVQKRGGVDYTLNKINKDNIPLNTIPPLHFVGAFNRNTRYYPQQVVSYQNSSYVCIKKTGFIYHSSGNYMTPNPTNTRYWSLLAKKGADGADGAAGTPGAAGAAGTSGANKALSNLTVSGQQALQALGVSELYDTGVGKFRKYTGNLGLKPIDIVSKGLEATLMRVDMLDKVRAGATDGTVATLTGASNSDYGVLLNFGMSNYSSDRVKSAFQLFLVQNKIIVRYWDTTGSNSGNSMSNWSSWQKVFDPAYLTKMFSSLSENDIQKTTILTGSANHGATLPLPAGYTEKQCKFVVSFKGGYSVSGDMVYFQCWLNGVRTVQAAWHYTGGPNTWANGSVNYLVIGVK